MSWEKEENRSRHVDFQCVKSKRNRFQNIKNTEWILYFSDSREPI